MTEPNLEQLIELRYPAGEWAVIFELQKGVGWRGTDGRIDAAAFGCWPSKGHHRLAFEVKRSRGDFLRELKSPQKRKWVEENFHQTWFVVPSGLVKPEEVPESWGLLTATKDGKKLRQVKVAMHREVPKLPESMALSAIRSMASTLSRVQSKEITFEGETITQADVDKKVAACFTAHSAAMEKLSRKNFEQQAALREDRHNLVEPLALLAGAVFDSWKTHKMVSAGDGKPCPVTADQVREWLAGVDAIQNPHQRGKLEHARDALNEILGDK